MVNAGEISRSVVVRVMDFDADAVSKDTPHPVPLEYRQNIRGHFIGCTR